MELCVDSYGQQSEDENMFLFSLFSLPNGVCGWVPFAGKHMQFLFKFPEID